MALNGIPRIRMTDRAWPQLLRSKDPIKPTEALIWEFPKIGGTLYFGVRIIMILLFRVLY